MIQLAYGDLTAKDSVSERVWEGYTFRKTTVPGASKPSPCVTAPEAERPNERKVAAGGEVNLEIARVLAAVSATMTSELRSERHLDCVARMARRTDAFHYLIALAPADGPPIHRAAD